MNIKFLTKILLGNANFNFIENGESNTENCAKITYF
jgi:hypothetical protein